MNKNKEYKDCKNKLDDIKGETKDIQVKNHSKGCDTIEEFELLENKASEMYENIRRDNQDIAMISENLKLNRNYVQKVKDYVFYKEHSLINGKKRFDPDINIAENWGRLKSNQFIKSDLEWLLHEFAELTLAEEFPNAAHDSLHCYSSEIHNWINMLL